MAIQWFPGHMNKAKKAIAERLKSVDMVIEMLDARLPASSENPLLAQLAKGKPKLKILNKQDLADPERTTVWLAYFNALEQTNALALDSSEKSAAPKITAACRALVPSRKGMDKPLRVLICGIPNVGKSTFINAFVGRSTAKTGNKPGVTRGNQWIKLDKNVQLLDTPGITWPKFEREIVGYNLALIGSINDDILPIEDLVFYFLKYLVRYYPKAILDRYGIEPEEGEAALSIMDKIAVKRACIKKGGDVDYTRVSRLILDDFRSGRLGKISLEHPGKWSDEGDEDSAVE